MKKANLSIIKRSFIAFLIFGVAIQSCELENDLNEDDYEPNDSEEKATQITTYDSIQGNLGTDDVDFYQFDASRNYIDFTQVNITNLSTTNEIETRIFDEYLDEISKLIGTQGQNMKLRFANTGGRYFIKLKSYNDREGDYSITVKELNSNDTYEPDNTIEQGRVIESFPSGEMIGTILTDEDYPQIDHECFKVLVKAGNRVDFDIIPSSSEITLHLDIYNANKEMIESVDKPKGESITTWYLYNTASSDVTMYLRLNGDVPDDGGDYRINFEESVYQGSKKNSGASANH